MINIITGRASSGKTHYLYNVISELDKNNTPAYLVVPEQFSFENEKKLITELNKTASMNTKVVSLMEIVRKILSKTPHKDKKVLSEEGYSLIIKKVIGECYDELSVYKQVAQKYGFCDNLKSFFNEMKKNKIDVEDLKQIPFGDTNTLVGGKLNDVILLYSKLGELVGDDYLNETKLFELCAKNIDFFGDIKESVFLFDNFHSFDKNSYCLIREIMKNAKECYFTFTYDEGDLFFVTRETIAELSQIAKDDKLKMNFVKCEYNKHKKEEFNLIDMHLCTNDEVRGKEESSAIRLDEYNTLYDEVEGIAIEISHLIMNEGYRYNDIAVVVSNLSQYTAVISQVFESYKISHFVDERKEIIYSSPVKAFLYLIEMLDSSYKTSDLIAYAKTGFTSLSDDEIFLVENYFLEFGIKGSNLKKEFTKNSYKKDYDLEKINALVKKLVEPIEKLKTSLIGYKNVGEFVVKLYEYLEESSFSFKIKALATDFGVESEISNMYAQIYNKIIEVLEQLYDFFSEEEIKAKELHELLSYCFVCCNIGVIPNVIDKVQIADTLRSRASSVKAVFALGANEGSFPSSSGGGGIMTDAEISYIKEHGLKLSSTDEYMKRKERFVIYTLLVKPSERLYVSRYKNMAEGGENFSCAMFQRLTSLFPNSIRTEKVVTEESKIVNTDASFNRLVLNLSKRINEGKATHKNSPFYDELYEKYKKYPKYSEVLTALEKGLAFENQVRINDKKAYCKAISSPYTTSITRLERYSACPFSFFSEYVLKLTEKKVFEVKVTDIGSVLHKVIELYSKKIISGEIDPKNKKRRLDSIAKKGGETCGEISCEDSTFVDYDSNVITEEIVEQVLSEYGLGILKEISSSEYLRRKLLRKAQISIEQIERQLSISDFLLKETEAEFKLHKKHMPIVMDLGDGERLYIHGVIDRIDSCIINDKNYVRIIDYKTGDKDFDIVKAYYGLSLQLPIYFRAMMEEDDDVMNAGLFYFRVNVKSTKLDANGASEEELKKLIEKQFKLKGITIKDVNVIKKMDHNAESQSFINNVKFSKDELANKNNLFTNSEFIMLLNHIDSIVKNSAKNILGGNIRISPYKYGKDESSCTYCKFKPVCKFSEEFRGNKYRRIFKLKESEIFSRMSEEENA